MPMLPQDLNHLDRQTWRRIWITFAILVIALVLACAVFAPPAGAAKRPGPPPPTQACIQISAVDPLMEGTYRATVGQQRRIVRVRVKDAPALKAGCWRPVQFRQWFEVGA